ncbi:MAG: hypothetical protein WBB31_04030 [Saprospiraceae bacterium]
MMKIVLILSIIFLFSLNICFSQSKVDGFIGFDISIPIYEVGDEYGNGVYNVNARSQINTDFNGGLNCWVFKNLGFSFGLGLSYKTFFIDHQLQFAEFQLPSDFNNERRLKVSGGIPSVGVVYKKGRFRTGISFNQLFRFNKNYSKPRSYHDSGVIDFPHSLPFIIIAVKEETEVVNDAFAYSGIQFYIQYTLAGRFNLNVGLESNLFNIKQNHYSLKVFKYPEAHINEIEVLEDFHVSNKYRGFNIGLYYLLGK